MDSISLVPSIDEDVHGKTYRTEPQKVTVPDIKQRDDTPFISKDETDSMHLIRKKYLKEGHTNEVVDILMQGWRSNTKKQYQVYLLKWSKFCVKKHYKQDEYNVKNCLEFLVYIYKRNKCSYSALNTARSALSCLFDTPSIGDNTVIKRFMRSVYNSNPTKPRYSTIWDVSIVLKYLEKKSPARSLNLKELTMKLLMLCALVTAQRCQTLHAFDLREIKTNHTNISFKMSKVLKHNKPSRNDNEIILPSYPDNKNLCVVTYMNAYINRTKPFRQSTQLFLSFIVPHKPVSKETISRWLKIVLQKAGVDTKVYKAHSTRAAATSSVYKDVDITTIMKAAGWSNAKTFATYYNKKTEKKTAFGRAVLGRK